MNASPDRLRSGPVDLHNETPLSLPQAARLQPPGRSGRPVNPATIFRWIFHGVRGPNGETIRLEGYRMGGRWLTTVEAIERFATAQTPDLSSKPMVRGKTPAARTRAAEKAAEQLQRLGI